MPQKTDTLGGVVSNPEGHTRGPWFRHPHGISIHPQRKGWREESAIAVMVSGTRTREEARANADIVAAAPDLLEALEAFVSEYVELVESGDAGFWDAEKEPKVIAARTAIAKARGLHPHTQEGVK